MLGVLVPFLLLVIIYYVTVRIHDARYIERNIRSAVLKCLPIFYLFGLVAWVDVGESEDVAHLKKYVTLGLVASMWGDWFLNWMEAFYVPGALCFMVAHAMYMTAFGWGPMFWTAGVIFGLVTLLLGLYLNSIVIEEEHAVAKNLMTFYFGVISMMAWRAYAYYASHPTQLGSFEAMIGAIVFMVSDFIIVATAWHVDTTLKELFFMTTYYIAQLLISFSVLLPSLVPTG